MNMPKLYKWSMWGMVLFLMLTVTSGFLRIRGMVPVFELLSVVCGLTVAYVVCYDLVQWFKSNKVSSENKTNKK